MSEMNSIITYAEDLADAEAPVALPKNDYPAEIVAATDDVSANSGKRRADVTFVIKPEDFPADYADAESFPDGKQVHYYVSSEPDKGSRFRMKKFCQAIGAPMGSQLDLNEWIGKVAIVSIEQDDFEGVPRERITKVQAA